MFSMALLYSSLLVRKTGTQKFQNQCVECEQKVHLCSLFASEGCQYLAAPQSAVKMCYLVTLKCCEKWGFPLKSTDSFSPHSGAPWQGQCCVHPSMEPLLQGHVQNLLAPSANPLFFTGLGILGGWWLLPAWL